MATEYEPKPIPTDHITFPDEVVALIELLAENAHDLWALERLRTGWVYGRERDDDRRRHPCLVPYAQLPAHERDVDRVMVAGSVRAIMALGFSITRDRTTELSV